MKRILIIEPYYGGSHKLFLQGLQRFVQAEYILLALPARKWKMRMQLSALWFYEQVSAMVLLQRSFDTVLCSTFVDVAVLRTLLQKVPGWSCKTRFCTYYHENQFAYPSQLGGMQSHQFTAINFTTALASDSCAFNSRYNMESFLTGVQGYLSKASDMKFSTPVQQVRKKSLVLYPGMDYSFIDQEKEVEAKHATAPVIVWNHRWEYDKGPEIFFDALYTLQEEGIPFRLIVLGQSFVNMPPCFAEANRRLQRETIHFGFVESAEEYGKLLKEGDILVSSARHEFFGISVLEGIRAGCRPLLPHALSYPELYNKEFLYKEGRLLTGLKKLLLSPEPLQKDERSRLTERFAWQKCAVNYRNWLFDNDTKTEGK